MGFFVTLLIWAVFFVLSEVLRPKPNIENARPANIGDFQFPTATEGRVVPLIWGTIKMKGPNVVWYGDLLQEAITEKIKTGLFSSQQITKGFRYNLGIQFAWCRMKIDSVKRVWIGDDLVADGTFTTSIDINEPDLFGGDDLGNGGVVGTLRLFLGDALQLASTYLSTFQQQGGDTPAYRGTAYGVLEQGYLGNSTNIKPWSFELRRIPVNAGALVADQVVNGSDANPMAAIYEILTDSEWGFGFPAIDIDSSNFQTAANTLRLEGNGFSFQLESALDARDLIREIERQIDGVVFLNQITGKWQINLARGDYDIDLVPALNESNIKEVQNFTRGTWQGTTNVVTPSFADRNLDYKDTFALAQDMANVRIQSGVSVSASPRYPGVKDATLANAIAWRDLKSLSFPLAKASFIVDRTFYDTQPVNVLAWTDSKLGFVKLPMRVQNIDYGKITDNQIRLDCVQDIFVADSGIFGDPPGTGWTPPADTLVAYPTAEQLAFEAPRAFVVREPSYDGVPTTGRVWCGARRQNAEVQFEMRERHSSGATSGAYSAMGTALSFVKMGELKVAMAAGTAYPTDNVLLTTGFDTQAALVAALPGGSTTDVGTNLQYLLLVGTEFILVTGTASINGADVELDGLYRGAMDSVQEAHAIGADVYVLSGTAEGGNLGATIFINTHNVDVKLIPQSLSDELTEASATAISFAMDKRAERPYPPSATTLNTVLFPTTTGLEGNAASGLDVEGITHLIRRRDVRTGDGLNELTALLNDAATIFADYPSKSEEHQIEVRNDPDGANTLLYTITWFSAVTQELLRRTILRHTNGVLPTRMRVVVLARHTLNAVVLQSRNNHLFDFDVTSNLTGDFNFGALLASVTSNLYTATAAGTYNFNIGTAFTVGNVEYRLNGGAWTTLIAAASTSGSIVGVVATDTIEVRHTSTDVGAETMLTMTAAGAGQDGYGVLHT